MNHPYEKVKTLPAQTTRRGYPASDIREFQEGTSWFPFFRPFFVEGQRKGIKEIRERVPQAQ